MNLKSILGISFTFTLVKYIPLILNFLRSILIASVLGPNSLGEYALIILVLEYLNYSNLGVFFSMNREVAISLDKVQKKEYIQKVINNSVSFALVAALIISSIILLLNLLTRVYLPAVILNYLPHIISIMILFQLKTFFLTYFRLFDKYLQINLLEVFSTCIVLACIYFSINDFGIDGILLSTIFGNLIVMIFMISVFREFKFSITLDVIKPLVIAGIPMLFFNLLVTLMIGIDRIAVASVMNTSTNALGIYHFGYLFSMGIFTAFNAVAFLFIPKFFKQYHNEVEDRDDVELIIKQTSLTEIIVTLLSVVGIFAVPLFITLFLPEYIASIKVTQLLLFSYIINATAFFASTHLLANDMQMRIMPLIMIVVFFSYFLNLYVLDLGLGLYGVALASSLAFGTYGLGVFCLYLQSEKKPLLTNIIRVYWRLVLFFLVSVFVIWEDLPLYYLLVLFIIIYGLKIRYFWINYSNLLFDNLKIR